MIGQATLYRAAITCELTGFWAKEETGERWKINIGRGRAKNGHRGKKSGVEGLVMAAFKFTEKDKANFWKAQRALTKATATAETTMMNFGIATKIMKDKANLEAKP